MESFLCRIIRCAEFFDDIRYCNCVMPIRTDDIVLAADNQPAILYKLYTCMPTELGTMGVVACASL